MPVKQQEEYKCIHDKILGNAEIGYMSSRKIWNLMTLNGTLYVLDSLEYERRCHVLKLTLSALSTMQRLKFLNEFSLKTRVSREQYEKWTTSSLWKCKDVKSSLESLTEIMADLRVTD